MFWIDKTYAQNPVVAPRGLEFAHLGVGSHGKTGRRRFSKYVWICSLGYLDGYLDFKDVVFPFQPGHFPWPLSVYWKQLGCAFQMAKSYFNDKKTVFFLPIQTFLLNPWMIDEIIAGIYMFFFDMATQGYLGWSPSYSWFGTNSYGMLPFFTTKKQRDPP